ncbi:hypothetical protein LH128_06147 [Sphingomonas sp. LH128]|uniref:hypothetical protein n=1 Tax=Sphingomonas sp. LH128 TaxID=473781 RepID=UPI00027CADF3|nr:hypothetical protein [Sphingomonas sp. LH128]EJU13948.1 hypothetical protein LH128_06147 [Sphingomonas sp. LH128]
MSKTESSTPIAAGKGANVVALPAKIAEPTPSDKVIAFVKKHPVLTVAGGVAVGVAVSALLPRRVSRRIVARTLDLAEAAGTASVVLGRKVGDKAHDIGIDARKQASKFADSAEKASDLAILNLEKYGLAAVGAASALGRATARRASRLGDAAADTANRLGDAAAVRSTKVLHMAEDLKKRVRS